MLQPKKYVTPNAVDAGEAPPSRPSRRQSNNWNEEPSADEVRSNATRLLQASDRHPSFRMIKSRQTESIAIEVDRGNDYSTNSRTHNDRGDEEAQVLTNNGVFSFNHDEDNVASSMPSVEEARSYADRILSAASQTSIHSSPESAERSRLTLSSDDRETENKGKDNRMIFLSKGVPLVTPPHVLEKQKRYFRRCLLGVVVIGLLGLIIGIAVYIVQASNKAQPSPSETTVADDDHFIIQSPRLVDVLSFLSTFNISSGNLLDDVSTPQYQAAVWLADHDALQYDIPHTSVDISFRDFVQRYTLAVLYFSMNGYGWVNQNMFLDKVHICGWFTSLRLDDGTDVALGVSCNEVGEVEELLMPRNNMVGTIPWELSHLTSLHFVDLNRNGIQGTIPDQFENLERMQFFDLRYNQLTGSIPIWIGGSWGELTEFALVENNMTGTLPSSMRFLQKLKSLSLAHNQFSGSLEGITELRNLEYLYLEENHFSGEINDGFLFGMLKMKQVDISSNDFSGTNVPLHLLQHSTLEVLDLGDNDLMGTIPTEISENTVLRFLSLNDNTLNGSIPASISQLIALEHLDVTDNGLTGEIPSSLKTMESLTYLFLGQNLFQEGPLPEFLSGMNQLKELSLSSTQRNGTIVKGWLTGLRDLKLLDLSWNDLSGSLPVTIWEHPNLQFLLLNRNHLTGDIPEDVTDPMVKVVLLDKNKITGDLTAVCNFGVMYMSADCSEVSCDCCACCTDGDLSCNNGIWQFNEEFNWEQNYTRGKYAFAPQLLEQPSTAEHN